MCEREGGRLNEQEGSVCIGEVEAHLPKRQSYRDR